ncbi:hypothetical protein [Apibacter mensalis]|uniref:DUF6965 family protein n=1 Tax=Apibacter mensalis TaxID=1586267 RepID=UPI0026EBC052|nr:hypothetical protein [Apibacter mensalis]
MKNPYLTEIEDFFDNLINYPKNIKIDGHLYSENAIKKLIKAEIIILKNQSGKKGYLPYYYRLLKIYNIIKNKNHEKFKNDLEVYSRRS